MLVVCVRAMLHNRACTPPCRAMRGPSEANGLEEPSRMSLISASPRVPLERRLGLNEENETNVHSDEECEGGVRATRTERSPSWCVTYAMPRPSTCSFSIRRVSEDMTGLERSSTTTTTNTAAVMNATSLPRLSYQDDEEEECEQRMGQLGGVNEQNTEERHVMHRTWPGPNNGGSTRGSRVQLALWPLQQQQQEAEDSHTAAVECGPTSTSTPSHHHLQGGGAVEEDQPQQQAMQSSLGNDMTQCFRTPEVCRYSLNYHPTITSNSNELQPCAAQDVGVHVTTTTSNSNAWPVVPSLLYTPQVGSSTLALRGQLDEELDTVNALYRMTPLPAMTTVLEDALYVGGLPDAETLPRLRECGVTHIINCCAADYTSDPTVCNEYTVHEFAARDQTDYLILHHCGDAFVQLVQGLLQRRERVFVHCIAGVNRSIALCVYFLMECHGMTPIEAVRLLHRQGRMRLLENVGFRHQLIDHQLSSGGAQMSAGRCDTYALPLQLTQPL